MALAIILRKLTKLQATPNIFQLAVKIDSRQTFTQLHNNVSKVQLKQNVVQLVRRNMSADHSKLWPIEKAVTIAILGLTPLTFLTPNIVFDDLFAITTVAHFHWGLEACVVDYVRPLIVGPVIPKITLVMLYLISISTLGGLLYYNHHNIGLGNTVRKFWSIQK